MKHNTLCLIFLFFLNQVQSQLLFDVESFNFSEDTIISMTVGDPDNNGKDDIFVTVSNKNLIYKLQNNGVQFSKTPYLSKEKPDIFSIISLNGEDDIVYTEKDKSTIHLMYGKDSYYNEKSYIAGIDLGTSAQIKSIGDVQPVENLYSNRFLYAIDQNNLFHILAIYTGSFNSVGSELKASIPVGIPVQQACGYYFQNRVSRLFFPDIENGKLKAMVKKWDNFQGPYIEPNFEVIDENLDRPVACLTHTSGQNGDVMFVIDKGSKSLVKYYLNENYRKEIYNIDIDNPTQIAVGLIDNNAEVDMIILDGKKLWLLTDLHKKGGSGAYLQSLIVEESQNIKNVRVSDFNGDGFSDIVYNLQGGNEIKVMTNEIKSAIHEVADNNTIKPNPSHGRILLDFIFEEVIIFNSTGGEVFRSGPATEINVEHLPKGSYLMKTKNNKNITSKLLIIN